MNIDHVVLWVSNQERSLDFFVNVVGLEPVPVDEDDAITARRG